MATKSDQINETEVNYNLYLDNEESEDPSVQIDLVEPELFVKDIDLTSITSKKFKIFGYHYSQIKWFNVLWLIIIHGLCGWAYIHALVCPVKVWTLAFVSAIAAFSGFGMSVGAHRLWAHRSFKARLPLRIFLALFQAMTVNGSCFSYARDHR